MNKMNMMNNNNMNLNYCPTRELFLFYECLEYNYKLNSMDYPKILKKDITQFKDRMNYEHSRMKYYLYRSVGLIGSYMLYDPIMEPLVQSSLAHFLYMKKYNPILLKDLENKDHLPESMPFQPLNHRLRLMDALIEKNASVTMDCIKVFDFTLLTRNMNSEDLMVKVNDLLQHDILKELVYSFIDQIKLDSLEIVDDLEIGFDRDIIQEEVVPADSLLRNRIVGILPTSVCGLIYSILIDLYLEMYLDTFINNQIKKYNLKCFWSRCLNTAILGIYEKDKFKNHIDLDDGFLLPVGYLSECGLSARERAATRGSGVLTPFRGKLYLNIDGHLQWEPPESRN